MKTLLGLVSFLAVATACSKRDQSSERAARETPPYAQTSVRQPAGVQVFGSVHELMMLGRTESRVELGEVAVGPGRYGLAALAGLRGEATVFAGESCLAYPDGPDKVRTNITRQPHEGAALLVVADVPRWRSVRLEQDVPFARLEAHIAEVAQREGWNFEQALPFLVEGPVRELEWHVVDGSRLPPGEHGHGAHLASAVRGKIQSGTPLLVGFFSRHHQGVFTHHDTQVHVHFVDRERRLCGHVDGVVVAAGAVLKVPAQKLASN
jgi:acetolactate decarboxylase